MRKTFTIFLFIISFGAFAQKIVIQESIEKVNDVQRQGSFVLLELDKEEVEKAWIAYLKNYGKPSVKSGVITVLPADIKAISSYPCTIYSTVEVSHVGSRVWWAIDLGSKLVTKETAAEYKGAEKMLYEFSVNAYREDINRQLVEAEKALISATKIQQKEVSEGLNLSKKLTKNKEEKIELEKQLATNANNFTRLNREMDTNIDEQKVALSNVEAVKGSHKQNPTAEEAKGESKSLEKALKEQKKKTDKGNKLASALENNKNEKIKLDRDLSKNATDLIDYTKRIEQNKKDQEAAALDVAKMKKAIEIVKGKMSSIQ